MTVQYKQEDTLFAEQHNTLVMIDEIIGKAHLSMQPVFEILGGTALLLHGVEAVFTVDIDLANRQSDEVKALIEPFVSDMASTVVKLPVKYKDRLVRYPEGEFDNIQVYILSIEDLVITKLAAWRPKDIEDLTKTGLFNMCDFSKLTSIINGEFEVAQASELLLRLASI